MEYLQRCEQCKVINLVLPEPGLQAVCQCLFKCVLKIFNTIKKSMDTYERLEAHIN